MPQRIASKMTSKQGNNGNTNTLSNTLVRGKYLLKKKILFSATMLTKKIYICIISGTSTIWMDSVENLRSPSPETMTSEM